jgi:glycosyltransferase involved in cell wall biosynthesis
MRRMKVVHLTSVHNPRDVRIFHKECKSLAQHGYEVTLIASGAQTEQLDGVNVVGVRAPEGRRDRVFNVTRLVYDAALKENADLYHFHDPELMPVGVRLKRAGKKVVYDVHEEVANDILDKEWIAAPLRPIVARGIGWFERFCATYYDGIVITRPSLSRNFDPRRTVLVHNYPVLGELLPPGNTPYATRANIAAYVGGGTPERGIKQLVQALELLPASSDLRLHFAGTITPEPFFAELQRLPGWQRVNYLGWQNRQQVADLLASARMGVVTFLPIANHLSSEPTKLFEYMSAKLPVVASNIPHWEAMVKEQGYGRLADPNAPASIAAAMTWLLDHPQEAEQMGLRGYEAVTAQYNWSTAFANLAKLYERILN